MPFLMMTILWKMACFFITIAILLASITQSTIKVYIPGISPGPASSPCTRTDKIWINPGTGSGGTVVALGVGNTMGCTNPSGWISPDVQHMEYWNDTDPSTVYTANISPLGIYTMTETTPSSGNWTIRYRNEMTSSPACEGPWFYEYFSN